MKSLVRAVREGRLVNIIQRLFPDTKEVAVEPLSQGKSGAVIVLARPIGRDNVSEVFRAVKVGTVKELRREARNFTRHVKNKLHPHPNLTNEFLPPSGFGGIAYEFVGNR